MSSKPGDARDQAQLKLTAETGTPGIRALLTYPLGSGGVRRVVWEANSQGSRTPEELRAAARINKILVFVACHLGVISTGFAFFSLPMTVSGRRDAQETGGKVK